MARGSVVERYPGFVRQYSNCSSTVPLVSRSYVACGQPQLEFSLEIESDH